MSALQSSHANSFSAHLALAAGVSVSISAPTLADLSTVVSRLQDDAANDKGTTAAPAPTTNKAGTKPAATPSPSAAPAEAGNASASTPAQGSAQPAAAGSATSGAGEKPTVTYDQVRDKVLALAKVSRETATGLLAKFTGQNGQPCDHANKMKLEDYPAFIEQANELLKAAGK